MNYKLMLFTVLVIAGGWQMVDCWGTGQVVGDLPDGVASDILSILVTGTVNLVGNCSDSSDVSEIKYCLFNRDNPNTPVIVTSPNQLDASKPIIVLIHGWGGNCDIDYIHVIKEAYLKLYDANIVSVDYATYAAANYQTAYCYVPAIGLNVAQFLCNATSALNVKLADIHVVGHSLGGQVAGQAGSSTQKTCGTIGRITGLDPAGPLYQGVAKANRLDSSDAAFVDVIHTNQGEFGYIGDCGHVNFYPNCGYLQPGCVVMALNDTSSIGDIANVPLEYIDCNHQDSCRFFAESINSNSFRATNCIGCGLPVCLPTVILPARTYMGESCKTKPTFSAYTLSTNPQSPYAKGPQGPPN